MTRVRPPATRAVRLRLAAVNLGVVALVLLFTLGAAALSSVQTSRAASEQDLRRAAARVLEHLTSTELDDDDEHHHGREGDRRRTSPRAGGLTLRGGDEPGFVVLLAGAGGEVARADGRPIPTGLPDEEGLRAALGGREALAEVLAAGEPVRALTVPVRRGGAIVGAVQVAKPTSEARAALTRTLVILAAAGLVGLCLSAVGSLFLAARAMRPIELALERQRRFLADASHELRTPVAVIRARAELLASAPGGDESKEELRQLGRDAEELSELLGELLDLARLDATDEPLERAPVPLADVAEELVAELRALALERGVTLSASAEPVFALADLRRLRQALRALCDNALAHAPRGGHVTVSADIVNGRARLVVRDDGEGIPTEQLEHVTERFHRADAARTRSGRAAGGAGLGLSIARELVLRMHGDLRIESQLGLGTSVEVLLDPAR